MILYVFLEMPIEAHCYANYPCFRIGPNLPDGLQPPHIRRKTFQDANLKADITIRMVGGDRN